MMKTGAAAAVSLAMVLAAPVAGAQGSSLGNITDDWRWAGTLYVWGAGISGETQFPPPANGGASVGIDAKDVINAINGVFMGAIEGRKGRYGFLADYVYLNLKADKSAFRNFTLTGPIGLIQLPADVSAEVGLGIKGNAFNLAGTYTYIDSSSYLLQSLAGVRYLKIDSTLTYRFTGNVGALPPAVVAGTVGADPHKWDAIIGAKGQWRIGDSAWTVPYYLDIGTGQSDFTWQALGGVGYQFGWGALSLVYRHLDYRFSNEPAKNLRFSGPAGAVTFRW
jgi:hypothetical protein